MSSRKFNGYFNATEDIYYSVLLCKQMVDDIDVIMNDYSIGEKEAEYLVNQKEKILNTYNKYKDKVFNISDEINDELLIPKNVEYSFANGKYPKDASDTYKNVKKEFEYIFEIEDDIFEKIVVPIWEKEITSCQNVNKFNQGDQFTYVVHSACGYVSLPGTQNYRDSIYNNNEYISCSLHTDKTMGLYNNKVGLILKIDKDSLISSSKIDCAAATSIYDSVLCVKENSEGNRILAGYSYANNDTDVVTKLLTPKAIERYSVEKCYEENSEILNNDFKEVVNEVVLDKKKVSVDGIYLQTNGCDFVLNEYIAAKEMSIFYGKPLRVINKSSYRRKHGLAPFTEKEYENYKKMIEYYKDENNYKFLDENPEWYLPVLSSYLKDVVYSNDYVKDVEKEIVDIVNNMKTYLNILIDDRLKEKYESLLKSSSSKK